MSTEVKQEGEFKVKKPSKPKNLGQTNNETIKVDLTSPEATGEIKPEITKVVIKEEDDAVQAQETNDSNAIVEEPKDSSNSEEVVEEVRATDEEVESPLQEITEEEEQEVKDIEQEVQQAKADEQVLGKPLPENIEKLVSFMEETGGTVEDYVRLNKDYSNIDNTSLLREYYRQTKPHLDSEDISILLEDFTYDEDLDDEKQIRKTKIAFKEEIGKAKKFLDGLKGKYYEEIKLRPGVTQEQKKAMEFFNQYNEEQNAIKQKHERFKMNTSKLFNKEFKGFDFNVSDKKFRYSVKNTDQTAEVQSDISNFVKTFLDKNGEVSDHKGYHKALYAARNPDVLATHFYEQGKADAIKDQLAKSRNINTEPRKTATGDVFVNGLKVRAISGADSNKLKVKTKRFN
jgi:hypothetical protein